MAEREWREAIDLRSPKVATFLVLTVAAVLRFWNLSHGIPYAVGADEPAVMSHAVGMMKNGDFNPHFFDYPGLVLYLHLIVASVRFVIGASEGAWHSLSQVSEADFYLWARAVTAVFGTLTVAVVYTIGMRWGARHALLAAGLMAVMPMHVRESHYALTDVPMTFFVTLTFLLTLRAHESGAARAYWWAGVGAGLAAASKYTGALVLTLPLVAAWTDRGAKPSRLTCALLSLSGAAVAFLLCAPFTVLDLPAFLNAFGYVSLSYRPRPPKAEPGWLIYLKHLRIGFGWAGFLLGLGGTVFGVVRAFKGPGHVRWLLLVLFPLLYFYFIAGKGLIFGRYLLPMIPFACLLIANAVVSGVSVLRRFAIPRAVRTTLIAGLTIAAILPPALQAVRFNTSIGGRTTQQVAYEWLVRAVPPKSKIAVEDYALRLTQPPYRPVFVGRLTEMTREQYLESDVEYAVLSSYRFGRIFSAPDRHADEHEAYRQILDRSQLLTVVRPDDRVRGPELRIYKLNP